MNVLLKKDVVKLGKMGDVVDVTKGYARNYLLPRGIATTITPGNLAQIEIARKKHVARMKEEFNSLQEVAEKLAGYSVTIVAKANEEGKLFGSVTAEQIAETLNKEGYPVEKEMVLLESPIKQCDVYNVPVRLHPDLQPECKIWVIKETEDTGSEAKN